MLIFTLLIFLSTLYADYQNTYFEIFSGRQPSSRAEALGRGYVAVDNDLDTYYFNPAGIANITRLKTKFTTSNPLYSLDKARYFQYSLGYNVINDIKVAFNINYMTYGEKSSYYNASMELVKKFTPTIANYAITIAKPLNESFAVGCNINYFDENYVDEHHNTLFFDAGTIYKQRFSTKYAAENQFNIGVSIRNFTFAKVDYSPAKEELPVISRLGMSYSFLPNTNNNFINVFWQAEYKYLLNYKYNNGLHTGVELKLFDTIAFRAGYYYENVDDLDSSLNVDHLSEFTYGLGIDIPIYKYINLPCQLQLDYTNLKQPSYVANYDDWDNFNSFTFKLALMN